MTSSTCMAPLFHPKILICYLLFCVVFVSVVCSKHHQHTHLIGVWILWRISCCVLTLAIWPLKLDNFKRLSEAQCTSESSLKHTHTHTHTIHSYYNRLICGLTHNRGISFLFFRCVHVSLETDLAFCSLAFWAVTHPTINCSTLEDQSQFGEDDNPWEDEAIRAEPYKC